MPSSKSGVAMAIYHLNLNVGSRSGGQSARAKSEYIEREGKYEKDSRGTGIPGEWKYAGMGGG